MTYIILAVLALVLFVVGIISLITYAVTLVFKKPQTSTMEPTKTTAKDIFVYLGIFITLCVSVGNFIQIVFTAIDQKYRDVITTNYDIYNDGVRMAIASLCVLFPLYVFLSWVASKDISKFLYKRDLLVRKVMIYTALFVTVCTLLGTLITAIYTFLGGDLTVRFAWKAVTVLVIALVVFGYYYYALKRNYMLKTSVPFLFGIVVTAIVAFSVVWSVMAIGTPSEMRAKRVDNTRLTNLSNIQSQIYSNFQTTEKLPATLGDLTNAISGFSVPVDPVTNEQYGYKVMQQPVFKMNYTTNRKELVTPAIFELCAKFDTERKYDTNGRQVVPVSPSGDTMYSVNNYYYDYDTSPFWNHGIGDTCFKRIISSDIYYGGKPF